MRAHLRILRSTLGSCLVLLGTLALSPAVSRAQLGVSDDRVALPDGPGSIGGVGENLSVSSNMGMMSYAVLIEVPEGFAGATPSLSLVYDSGAGNGEVGIGWELPIPHLERMTLYGLPRYDSEDRFAVDGSQELVRVQQTGSTHVYRARFEGSFVRYTWHADAGGKAGYFEAEYADGSRGFFGADANGHSIAASRVTHPDGGVFRYLLVDRVDRFGHRVHYEYTKIGEYPLLSTITYLFGASEARYRIAFSYASRADVISSALPGFDLRLEQRLSGIEVYSGQTRLRRYELRYEETDAATSRLVKVQQHGLDDALFPIAFSFSYSQSLSVNCPTCDKPVMHDMGTLPGSVDLRNGRSTLIDINGDALPDLLDTGLTGEHRFFVNALDTRKGEQSFLSEYASTQTLGGSSFLLSAAGVQVVDVNGDGFTDMINAVSNDVLCNDGSGDWVANGKCASEVSISGLEADQAGEADPHYVRFLDYDGDRRIDLMRTVSNDSTVVLRNTPDQGFVEDTSVQAIGSVFDDSSLQLGDINGDGLLDPVEVNNSGSLRYRLNLGRGQWSAWEQTVVENASMSDLQQSDLQDLNGDGLDDLVVVQGNTVKFSLNHAGEFLPMVSLTSADVTGDLPERVATTSVLFADMNGSGSTDVVWIDQGRVRFLELFAVRPNLLTRIENGIGAIQTVEYGTSPAEQARDEGLATPEAERIVWRHRLPQATNVVKATESWATLTPALKNRIEYAYHHGFYDGREKHYRGFEQTEEYVLADPSADSQEPGLTVMDFDVGADDPYFNGLLVRTEEFGGEASARHRLRRELHEYEDCPLDGVPTTGLRAAVRYPCLVSSETLLQESRPADEWTTLRTELQYDGYGNVILQANHGVVGLGQLGENACTVCAAPAGTHSGACGSECLGDEAYTETQYVVPGKATGGRWLLHEAYRTIEYGAPDGDHTEQLTFYDGTPFVGAALGTLTLGNVSRTCARITPEAAANCEGKGWVMPSRAAYDAHGNVVDTLDPLGSADDESGHRRKIEYDAWSLKPSAVEILLSNADGNYRLRRELAYDPVFDAPTRLTRWLLIGTKVKSDPAPTLVSYDAFGRRAAIAEPGDTLAAPTSSFRYELADPVSQVVTLSRSVSAKPFDLEQRQCVDGFGRTVQTRTQVADGLYQVTGFQQFNRTGQIVRSYQPYQTSSAACDAQAPAQVNYTAFRYDALARPIAQLEPDAGLYGAASISSTTYAPLATIESDAEDNDARSSAFNTPNVTRVDGLGRTIAFERYLGDLHQGGELGRIQVLYDALGRAAGYLDPLGQHKAQRFDLLGRVVHVDDPNAGGLEFAYDAAGNLLKRTDARGVSQSRRYDGANRLVAEFDAANEEGSLVEHTYDFSAACGDCANGEGQLVSARYPLGAGRGLGVDELDFDLRGRPVRAVRTFAGLRFVTATRFDNVGRVQSTTYPDGTALEQHYDRASRVVGIGGVLDGVRYDSRGAVAEERYANGTSVQRSYDDLQRLASLHTLSPDGKLVLQGFSHTHDRVGNLLQITDQSSARVGRVDSRATFAHDPWYRIRTAKFADETLSYGYDLGDNLTSMTSSRKGESPLDLGVYSYEKARANAVKIAGQLEYEYDLAGNIQRRGDAVLSWDHQGRLIQATREVGGRAEYVHGVDGRVMELHDDSTTYFVGRDFEIRDGISVTYARLGRERVARLQSAALQTTLLEDIAPRGAPDAKINVGDAWLVARAGRAAEGHLSGAARRMLLDHGPSRVFLHHDHLGSLTMATDSAGAVLGERTFYPTGEVRAKQGYVDLHGFTGQREDVTTGLVHFLYRELDPTSGRWASADPQFSVVSPELLGKWGESTTAYAYVGNGFASRIDRLGLDYIYLFVGASANGKAGHISMGVTTQEGFRTGEQLLRGGIALGNLHFGGATTWAEFTPEEQAGLHTNLADGRVLAFEIEVSSRVGQQVRKAMLANEQKETMGAYNPVNNSCVSTCNDVMKQAGFEFASYTPASMVQEMQDKYHARKVSEVHKTLPKPPSTRGRSKSPGPKRKSSRG